MTKTKIDNPIWECVQEFIDSELNDDFDRDRGVENEIKISCEMLLDEVWDYINGMKEQKSYPDDPYLYNGVSRSDFF